jgi:hypothetical protein
LLAEFFPGLLGPRFLLYLLGWLSGLLLELLSWLYLLLLWYLLWLLWAELLCLGYLLGLLGLLTERLWNLLALQGLAVCAPAPLAGLSHLLAGGLERLDVVVESPFCQLDTAALQPVTHCQAAEDQLGDGPLHSDGLVHRELERVLYCLHRGLRLLLAHSSCSEGVVRTDPTFRGPNYSERRYKAGYSFSRKPSICGVEGL